MPVVNFSDLRANMARRFDEIEADRTELVVTREKHEPVVILPLAELEGLRESLHLLGTPANAKRLREAIAELDSGLGAERALAE